MHANLRAHSYIRTTKYIIYSPHLKQTLSEKVFSDHNLWISFHCYHCLYLFVSYLLLLQLVKFICLVTHELFTYIYCSIFTALLFITLNTCPTHISVLACNELLAIMIRGIKGRDSLLICSDLGHHFLYASTWKLLFSHLSKMA